MSNKKISYFQLFEIFCENPSILNDEFKLKVLKKVGVEGDNVLNLYSFSSINVLKIIKKNYASCSQSQSKVLVRYKDWLKNELEITKIANSSSENKENVDPSNQRKRGRPFVTGEATSSRNKRRRRAKVTKHISSTEFTLPELLVADYKKNHEWKKARILEALESESNEVIDRLHSALTPPEVNVFTPSEALALYLDLGMTKSKYEALYRHLKKKNIKILPPYTNITEEKNSCVPDNILITEISAECPLQDLLDHTVKRIIESKGVEELEKLQSTGLIMYFKYGFDGSSQTEMKQILHSETEDPSVVESQLFVTSLVPLSLKYTDEIDNSEAGTSDVWTNQHPNSVFFCRPLRYVYQKEDKNLIQFEAQQLKNEIKELTPTILNVHGFNLTINHKLFLTMLDGKAVQHVTNTSSTCNCTFCKKPQKEFNSETTTEAADNEETEESEETEENEESADEENEEDEENPAEHGLGPLHARERFLEFTLKLSYDREAAAKKQAVEEKKPEKTNKRKTKEEREKEKQEKEEEKERKKIEKQLRKEKIGQEKARIIKECREKLGLIVDTPKQGFGNTNDGNTSRRFFKDPKLTASILGIEEEIITRFRNILNLINSRSFLDADKFGEYARDTLKLLREKYPSKMLTPTVHKILAHGADVMKYHIFPVGVLSEEAQESNHKVYKKLRLQNTCKKDRETMNRDLFTIMLASSDPLISSLRVQKEDDNETEWPDEIKHIIK